jgi:hypothetical protein
MQKILFGIVCMLILGCTTKSEHGSRARALEERGITSDTCSFCALDGLVVESIDGRINTNITIDYPVAIELMDRVEWVRKYEEERYDTLMKLLKMKHWADRGEIYELYGLHGYYTQDIKPVLLRNSVIIIDTIKHEQYVTIKDGREKYVIDLLRYRQDDGVLMFTPGKKPIYWNMEREDENCYWLDGFPKWYFECR